MATQKFDYCIVDSLLDTDLYKVTMLQAFFHAPEFREMDAEWKFACRNPHGFDLSSLIPEIKRQLEHVFRLHFTAEELLYLSELPFITVDFIEFLREFRLQRRFVNICAKGKDLDLRIKGPLIDVALFEIYLLAIISELNTSHHSDGFSKEKGKRLLQQKIDMLLTQKDLEGFSFVDFGTRRRASRSWQQTVLEMLKEQIPHYFAGTSNLSFAMLLELHPVGTMAHEWFQAWQAATELADAQKNALTGWIREFNGQLGIALTDCYSMDSFINDFDQSLAIQYDGLRHDSGSPFAWGEKAIQMYKDRGIDPRTKTLVFSDKLNFPKMLKIHHHFKNRVKTTFGIGTNLTNDVGTTALDIVIKLVAVNGRPVAKISDEPGKSMCEDASYLEQLAKVYKIDFP